jgi:hypothetical protein
MDEKIISQDSNSSNPTNPSLAITEVSATDSNGRPSLLWTLGSQILVLVWLALIIALLTSNFEKYIAGANVGCDVVHGDRIGAQTLVTPYVSGDYDDFTSLHTIVTAQSLSLINYSMKDIDAASSAPTLQVDLPVIVWSYGFESRTSKLGAVIAVMGGVIVLIRMVVGNWARTVHREPLGFVTTALDQRPPGVFKGLCEKDV